MFQNLNFYLDFKWDDYASNQDNYFTELNRIANFAYQHKLNVYYSPQQLQVFKNNCSDWDDDFITSKANYFASILEDAVPVNQNAYFFSVLFAQDNTALLPIADSIISFIQGNTNISILSISDNVGKKHILKVRSSDDFEKIECSILNNVDSVRDWILVNSESRNFNLSQKHGENGLGQWHGESPLLCSKEAAQELLNRSIGDFRENSRLFIFDENHGTFLEFFYEGNNPQKQWHGFHLEEKDWEKRVPKSVRRFYGK